MDEFRKEASCMGVSHDIAATRTETLGKLCRLLFWEDIPPDTVDSRMRLIPCSVERSHGHNDVDEDEEDHDDDDDDDDDDDGVGRRSGDADADGDGDWIGDEDKDDDNDDQKMPMVITRMSMMFMLLVMALMLFSPPVTASEDEKFLHLLQRAESFEGTRAPRKSASALCVVAPPGAMTSTAWSRLLQSVIRML